MGLCTWMCSVVCAVCFEVDFCARALCVRAHAVVRAQGRALCADSGLPGLRAGGALTWADVLVLVCVLRSGTHMLIPRAATTSTPIGVHSGAMHGDHSHSPEDRASDRGCYGWPFLS